nr:PREDICTED: uric acid degradation bifunctional protein TTL-like isoform X2 [Musa acuminata subsp. malaccensis]
MNLVRRRRRMTRGFRGSPGDRSRLSFRLPNDSALQELVEWNFRYREKFGFVFLICASGRGTTEILAELKKRYLNRPIVELEIAAQEEMKIIELRLARLFNSDAGSNIPVTTRLPVSSPTK